MTAIIFIMVIVMMFYYRTEKEVPVYENDIFSQRKDRDQKFMDSERE